MHTYIFKQIWIVVECRQHLLSEVNDFEKIFAAVCFMPKTFVKFTWHELNNMTSSLASSLIVIRRLSKIIFFTASMLSSIIDVLEIKINTHNISGVKN